MTNSPKKAQILPDDPRHGTASGYRAGCHETCCKKAWSKYQGERQKVRSQEQPELNPNLAHGVYTTAVNHRCKCEPCRSALRFHDREHKRMANWAAGKTMHVRGRNAQEIQDFIDRMNAEAAHE